MKRSLLFITALFFTNLTVSQSIFNGTAVLDPKFDCAGITACSTVDNAICPSVNWQFVGDAPEICFEYPIPFAVVPFGVEGNYCKLTNEIVNNHQTTNQNLKASLSPLTPGFQYTLDFYYANVGSSGDWTGEFNVTIGDQVFTEELPQFSQHGVWYQATFVFCATASQHDIIISSPSLLNGAPNMMAQLAIDNIRFKSTSCPALPPVVCENCGSLQLLPNEKYLLSAWVKVAGISETLLITHNVISYETDFYIDVIFDELLLNEHRFTSHGEIIDGWQKITGEFTVPEGAAEMRIEFTNSGSDLVFFDDIRIHPVNSNLKSFVYDQQSQKLMAELDENNYATFYEYDKEGGLVRVKKETEKGVFTIQETRSGNVKKPQ